MEYDNVTEREISSIVEKNRLDECTFQQMQF